MRGYNCWVETQEAAYTAYWNELLDNGAAPPLHRAMGLSLVQLTPTTVLTMELGDEVRGFVSGSVHGGILATFADAASATALWNARESDVEIPVTTDLHIRFFRQPTSGPLTAEVQVVHRGRQLLTTECAITDGDGRLLARSSGTFALHRIPQAR